MHDNKQQNKEAVTKSETNQKIHRMNTQEFSTFKITHKINSAYLEFQTYTIRQKKT